MVERRRSRYLVALLGGGLLLVSAVVPAQAPQLAYSPQPDQVGTEVNFGGAPTTAIAVTPSGGGGDPSLPGNQSTLICSLADEGGDDNINFSPGALFFSGDTVDPQNFTLSCEALDDAPSFATLSCNEKIAGINTGTKVWDIVCPAGGNPVPELVATPQVGIDLVMASTQPTDDTENITIQNVGSALLTVSSITGLAPPFSASPPNAPIGAGSQQVFSVTCDGAGEGSFFDQLTINSDDADEGAIAYDVSCTVSGAEFDGVPAPGTTITLQTVQTQNVSTPIGVFNSGNTTLNITGLTLADASGKLSASIDDATIDAGASATITIACNAGAVGNSGLRTLTFNTNDQDGGETSISYPNISCDVAAAPPPTSGEFSADMAPPGPINLFDTTAAGNAQTVIAITNVGDDALTLSNLSTLNAPLGRTLSTTSLPSNGSMATLTITCGAATAQASSQSLSFNTNDPDDGEGLITYQVNCTVTSGAAPEFASTPAAPGPITINTTQNVTGNANLNLQNIGSAPLTLSVNTQPAAPVQNVTVSSPINNGGPSQNVAVSCNSATAGAFNRSFSLTTNDADENPVTYNVTCNVAQAAEFNSAPPAPGPLSFVTNQGVTSAITVSMQNQGTTNLVITAINVVGNPAPNPFTFSTAALPLGIAPGASANATVRCSTNTPGTYSGTATLTTNDPDDSELTVVFNLSCKVILVAPEYSSSPTAGSTVQFYTSPNATPPPAFEPFTTSVRISNVGNATLNYSLAGLSGAFASSPATPGNYTLAANATQTILVTCDGTNSSTVTQTLSITHNDANESPATYRYTCIPDVRRAALPLLRALIGSPLVTESGTLLMADGFE